MSPTPVILDTDIGLDVDDVWALALLLRCPELDVKLVTTSTGDTRYRAALVAKILETADRTDIPIGIGIPLDHSPRTHDEWLDGFVLSDFRGTIHEDGIGAMVDTVERCNSKVSIIAIGPLPNVAAALMRSSAVAENARLIGMHGSIRRGYLGIEKPMREYNVKQHSMACQAVFASVMEKVITPLDTCGTVALAGERFARVANSSDPLTRAVLDNHYGWCKAVADWPQLKDLNPQHESSTLFDCVAVYLALSERHLKMEDLLIRVTDDGKTLIDPEGMPVRCAMEWRNKEAFLDFLTDRLC